MQLYLWPIDYQVYYYYRVRRCNTISHYYHTPRVPISVLNISTVGMMSVPKKSALEASRRELSEDVSFGIGILFGCRAINRAGKPTRGGVAYSQEDR